MRFRDGGLAFQKTGLQRPTLLHIKTEKGFGYAPALAAPDRMHGVEAAPSLKLREKVYIPPASCSTACAEATALPSSAMATKATLFQAKSAVIRPSLTSIAANQILKFAERDKTVTAITAAMPGGTGLSVLGCARPSQLFDVGIAEQHAVTFAAGLAAGGVKPFCCIYSTFLQRAYDQIVHDVAIQSLPVRSARLQKPLSPQDCHN